MSEGDAEKTPAEMRNRLAAERVIQALNSRHMEGYFAASKEEASKLVHSLEDGISRVRHTAAPVNAQRVPGNTPCRQSGTCGDCRKDDCICSQLVITRGCRPSGRIKVILVGENLGY